MIRPLATLSRTLGTALFFAACSQATTPEPQIAPDTATTAPEPDTSAAQRAAPIPAVRPEIQAYQIVNTYPHDPGAFTQGLFFWQGELYESTGRHGESTVRRTVIETGEVTALRDIPPEYFGEGITRWKDRIIALTWRSGRGFILDLETLAPTSGFDYPGEGWGITANDTQLIQSDGSAVLRFLDPETLKITSTLNVRVNGEPLTKLNELEWINGEIWANVWQTDFIVRINPETGNVTAIVDFTGLFPASRRDVPNDDVLNGIAFNPDTGHVYITGKHWPNLYEIRVPGVGAATGE